MTTKAQRKALLAVTDGDVVRIYRRDGNVLKGPAGVGSATLRRLDRAGWIKDEPGGATGTHVEIRRRQVLTALGRDALGM